MTFWDAVGTAIFFGIIYYWFVRPFTRKDPPGPPPPDLPEGWGSQGW